MKKVTVLILSVFLANVQMANAQSAEKEIPKDLNDPEVENAGLNLINNQILQVNIQQVLELTGNNVSIDQVGKHNLSNVRSFSKNSTIIIQQIGNRNIARIDAKATSVKYNLSQKGTANFMAEYGKAPNLELVRSLRQHGDRNNLVIHGTNSITKDLKLNIQGNAKTVIIRNFN